MSEDPSEPLVAGARPLRIEAENFDDRTAGVTYFDVDQSFGNRRIDVDVDVWEFDEEFDGASGALLGRTRNGEFTEYRFAATQSGDYIVRLSLASGANSPGVIHVDIDGSRLGTVDGDTEEWFDWTLRDAGAVALNAGDHTIRLTWDDGANVNLDWLEVAPMGPQPHRCPTTTQEAETATLAGRFRVQQSADASAGAFVHVPRGSGGSLNGHNDNYVEFCFGVAESGTYQLDTALRAPTDLDNSFYVSIDNGPLVDFVAELSSSFTTVTVNDAVALDPITAADAAEEVVEAATWNLEAGDHTVRLYLRRDGAELDNVTLRPVVADGCTLNDERVETVATQSECDALIALYAATGGANWERSGNWDTPTDPCTWQGIECDTDGVYAIFLGTTGLGGPIPSEVGDLTNLKLLFLGDNQLTGTIPPELGNLTNLEFLALNNNQLTGTIPPELGNLASAQSLQLGWNQLTGPMPPELGDLASLESLDLRVNELTGSIPPELGDLAQLRDLLLLDNQLTGTIPLELGNLSRLENLQLFGNQLSGTIPHELGNLTNLRILLLSSNALTGPIPLELTALAELQYLWVTYNQLEGSIPAQLANLGNLVSLSLSSNQFTGTIPPELGNLTNLKELWIEDMAIDGPIPAELGNLAGLEELLLAYNELQGPIPPELGNLTNLQTLRLFSNRLTGPIPAEFAQLTQLEIFAVGNNMLSGDITEAMQGPRASIDDPNDFSIARNGCFTVTDPDTAAWLDAIAPAWADGCATEEGCTIDAASIETVASQSECDALAALYAATDGPSWTTANGWNTATDPCAWHGVVCSENGVTEIQLIRNGLVGPLPAELGNLSELLALELASNELTGPIPPELGRLENLDTLRLSYNQLSGSLPAELGQLANLDSLYLNLNRLTGQIPPELGQLSNLRVLVANANEFNGPIPPELGDLTSATTILFYDNNLTGSLPPELGQLANVQQLGFGSNEITGPIPPELGKLENLSYLWLGNNEIIGPLPPELGNLTDLEQLELDGNLLTGPVPAEFSQLTSLNRLWLQDNSLSGDLTEAMVGPRTLIDDPAEFALAPNGCFTTTDVETAAWLDTYEPSWARACDAGCTIDDQALQTIANQAECDALIALYISTGGANWTTNTRWNTATNPCSWHRVICGTSGVIQVWISDNGLKGRLPVEIGNLTNLETLILNRNQISGSVPAELADLRNLSHLALHGNELSGPIPPELGSLTNLSTLHLGNNDLTNGIPSEFSRLVNIDRLHLGGNALSGDITEAMQTAMTNITNPNDFGLVPNGCLFVTNPDVATWLETIEPGWDGGCR